MGILWGKHSTRELDILRQQRWGHPLHSSVLSQFPSPVQVPSPTRGLFSAGRAGVTEDKRHRSSLTRRRRAHVRHGDCPSRGMVSFKVDENRPAFSPHKKEWLTLTMWSGGYSRILILIILLGGIRTSNRLIVHFKNKASWAEYPFEGQDIANKKGVSR